MVAIARKTTINFVAMSAASRVRAFVFLTTSFVLGRKCKVNGQQNPWQFLNLSAAINNIRLPPLGPEQVGCYKLNRFNLAST